MNEYTKNMKTSFSADRKANTGKKNMGGRSVLLLAALFLVAVFGLFVLKIHLQAQIESMKRETVKLEARISRESIVLENRRNMKEQLCSWKNIQRNIAYFKLPLVQRKTSQITRLKRFTGENAGYLAERTDRSDSTLSAYNR